MKRCYFIGNKDLSESQKDFATLQLVGLIQNLISNEVTHFTIGLECDCDYLVANIISKFKKENRDIFLEAIIQKHITLTSENERKSKVFKYCNGVGIFSKKSVVDNSEIIIAIWDGHELGDTYNMITYAKSQDKKVILICV